MSLRQINNVKMDAFSDSPLIRTVKKQRFSDVVSSIISYNRQKGIQTFIFHSFAILFSVTLLFLLTQIYYIFLPCLKALLWALLCGSALYPFKVKLNTSVQGWLIHLQEENRSFCVGLLWLPFQLTYQLYWMLINFVAQNKFLFLLFHFRIQIVYALSMLNGCDVILTTIFFHNKVIITASIIIITTIQIVLLTCGLYWSFLQYVASFNCFPSLLFFLFFYILHALGYIGQVAFIFFIAVSLLGFVITINRMMRDTSVQSAMWHEMNLVVSLLGDRFKAKLQSWLVSMRDRFLLPEDSIDGGQTNLGKLVMSLLFTIFLFVLVEQIHLTNAILLIFCFHLLLQKIFNKIYEKLVFLIDLLKQVITRVKEYLNDKLQKDIIFQLLIYFFVKGDELIKVTLQNSLHLLTSLGLILMMTVLIVFSSVFLSVKIYGEFYAALSAVRNEVTNNDFIRESINLTLSEVTNADYLNNYLKNNLLYTDKLNLSDDDKNLLNKMLLDFGENIMLYLNASNRAADFLDGHNETNSLMANQSEHSFSFDTHQHLIKSFFQSLMTSVNLKKFDLEIVFNFINSRTHYYLPLFKSFLSIFYAFFFVILDGSTVVLGFVLNLFIFGLALYYLLSSSRNKYKPIEFLDNIVGSLVTNPEQNRFTHYVEEVVNSIFAATIKISAFYGVYTWLVHSLFGIQICCIPSVIAALLAAVPLLNAYWASLPACIYLYYFEPSLPVIKALSMFLIAILPSFIVDSSIYSDIKRAGHPYLTGLAITCGVVYYGVEGALFGPLWLCLLFIILNLGTSLTESNLGAVCLTP